MTRDLFLPVHVWTLEVLAVAETGDENESIAIQNFSNEWLTGLQ